MFISSYKISLVSMLQTFATLEQYNTFIWKVTKTNTLPAHEISFVDRDGMIV